MRTYWLGILDQKFNISFGEDKNNAAQRLKSMSISDAISESDISLESLYSFTSPPSSNIGDVFLFLQQEHKNQLVHFLVDEFNQEFLTNTYASSLHNILKNSFNNSSVVIALQSVSKQRTICSAADTKDVIQQSNETDFQSTGMKLFELNTAVRMTRQLFELQKNLESEIHSSPFKAALAYKGDSSQNIICYCILMLNCKGIMIPKLNI